ncbi:phosphoribosylaminoimidazolesuccinocarboxamide synthase [Streptomyces collinus]|uniref:phosphoribosylaminoimidazolesuccinocarboxamide synthase n=1 Tax=Streptomyces collinus TaxID=42684 RepID=UPI0036C7CF78
MPKRFSTKNLTVVQEPTENRSGVGIFEFTDDYSVFHYSKMPDQIPGKGEAICRMADFNFRMLEQTGIPTHFRRFIEPNKLEFTLVRVQNPAVEPIPRGQVNYLVPLQVIFRNVLAPNNSLRRRHEEGRVDLSELGLASLPPDGVPLQEPIVEFTTKLEEIDRFVSVAEARHLSGLDDSHLAELRKTALKVDDVITEHARSVGLDHADGKIEFGITGDGQLILVDNAGTPDENRLMRRGQHVGKQILRDFYLARGLEKQVQDWARDGVPRSQWDRPEPLPTGFAATMSDLYRSLCETWTGERIWGVPPLDDALETARLLNTGSVAW